MFITYKDCNSKFSEVSCYEVVRASEAIKRWELDVINNKTIGKVIVNVNEEKVGDRLSMLYQGMQIAIATRRKLVTNLHKFGKLILPKVIQQMDPSDKYMELPTDHNFACSDISPRYPNLRLNSNSWPQVLYTHHDIAPILRNNFGFHAAYFIGNYLFGEKEKPSECELPDSQNTTVEGFKYHNGYVVNPNEYYNYLKRCGEDHNNVEIITNQQFDDKSKYKTVTYYDDNNINEAICAIRKLTHSRRIIQTFGSRIGFWANALQGTKGGFINVIDRLCVNMTNSQQGSLWHTYCPPEMMKDVFRTNSIFYVCGPNAEDARLFIEYLLW